MKPNTLKRRRRTRSAWAAPLGLAAAILAGIAIQSAVPGSPFQANASRTGLPLFFIPNRGQASSEVQFMIRAPDLSAYFSPAEAVLRLKTATVRLDFPGGAADARLEGLDRLEGLVHLFAGNDPDRWITNIPTYGRIVYRQVYPGIDVFFENSEGRLKSEFVVAPGSSPKVIRCRFSGVEGVRIDGSGALVLKTAVGVLREERPEVYQEVDGVRMRVKGGFRLLAEGQAGFAVGPYDATRPLHIDPLLSYSSYFGGGGSDVARAIAVDGAGSAYVAGYTDSSDLPTKNPLQGANAGGVDVLVARFNVSGNALIYCTYLGGGWDDRGFGIAVDGGGNAYVTGWTYSPNFPTTSGARQRVLGGGRDAFVAKLNGSGSALVYSTYLGGSSQDAGNAIAVDSSGSAYVAGDTHSTNFPVINWFQGSNQGFQDAFVSKLNSDGSALVWSTYLGGAGDERGNALAVDSSGSVYAAGGTTSTNFPTFNALQPASGGGQDAFVAKLAADGKSLAYSTYLGGSGGTTSANEMATGVQVDSGGNVYLTGVTSSTNFPVVNALQAIYNGGALDAFAAKLNASGSGLLYSTYLGGASIDYALGISVNPAGIACVAGYTASTNFPTLNPIQAANAGNYDVFVAKLNPQGNGLESSTYWGGINNDAANAVFMDAATNVWIAGQTLSADFPVKNAVQSGGNGGLGAFVTKLGEITPTAVFRATNGNTILISYGSTALPNASGFITCEPGISHNDAGDTFVAGRNDTTRVYLNIFRHDTQTWNGGWLFAGDQKYGDPAVAALSDGGAYVVARDGSYRYWLNRYQPGSGFGGWIFLGGAFATEPAVAAGVDDSLYLAGAAGNGVVSAGRYVSGSGFQGWIAAETSRLAAAKPAILIGSDGAAYVAIKATSNGISMARFTGSSWGAWHHGGGNIGKGPDIAATEGTIYVAVTTPSGAVYVQPFSEGTVNGWTGTWIFLNGHLERAAIGAVRGRYYIAGRSLSNYYLWWHEQGVGWWFLGNPGLAASDLVAGPK